MPHWIFHARRSGGWATLPDRLTGTLDDALTCCAALSAELGTEVCADPDHQETDMTMTEAQIQAALIELGYPLQPTGKLDAATELQVKLFQLGTKGLVVDGDPGPKTQEKLQAALAAKAKKSVALPIPREPAATAARVVPAAWMPACKMVGIVVHWTGGPNRATWLDRAHYHLVLEGDATLLRGDISIKANAAPLSAKYAAHTLGLNTGWIGVSLACMAGAIESPFDAGAAPMTRTQWDALPPVLADLCRRYGIPVTPRTVLSHAEVQGTLGKPQRGKWDVARLAFDPSVRGAEACGDIFRARTSALLAAEKVAA